MAAMDADYLPSDEESYDVVKGRSTAEAPSGAVPGASPDADGAAGGEDGEEAEEGEEGAINSAGQPPRGDFADGDMVMPLKQMDRRIFEELLLVVQNLGTVDENDEFVRGEDCLMWLGDLQR